MLASFLIRNDNREPVFFPLFPLFRLRAPRRARALRTRTRVSRPTESSGAYCRQVAQISKPEFSLVVAFLLSFSKSSSFGDREIFHGWRKPACCCPPTGWRAYCLDTPAGCKVGRAAGPRATRRTLVRRRTSGHSFSPSGGP